MNSKEIRETIVRHAENHNPGTAEQNIAFWLSSSAQFLAEIAQQLAEQNEKLKILLNPPMMYDAGKIYPTAFEDLGNFIRPSITFMEPRATLRDQFAMAAITGCSSFAGGTTEDDVKYAYKVADLMMEARK